ncbi:MAG: CFI-box-CTERM domain-containing protein [Myxococcota bacterium]
MASLGRAWLTASLLAVLQAASAGAQAEDAARRVELRFTPADRAQIAVWIERPDGTFVQTIALTESVAFRGIGNRPGAIHMNTGFRYPFGRREGALPVWAHRRYEADGRLFPRVIFWGRESADGVHSGEGYASIHLDPNGSNTVDDHFCLSFTDSNNDLDAVSCASVFRSNKGRYVTDEDLDSGYAATPWLREDGTSSWRSLAAGSLYPPRRDIDSCDGCTDHPDVFRFAADAREIMSDIDAVTRATLPGHEPHILRFQAPPDWPDGEYVAWVEVHVEADYNDYFNPDTHPGPSPDPDSGYDFHGDEFWDIWAESKGVPSRGQPSVVFRVPFMLAPAGGAWFADAPHGYGELHGLNGTMTPMPDGKITDDPAEAPGSGADRLLMRSDGTRLTVLVKPIDVCAGESPHPLCGQPCMTASDCPDDVVDCGPVNVCVDYCDASFEPPPAVQDFAAHPHEDTSHSHEWATLELTVPESSRPITEYQVRYGTRAPPADSEALEAWFGEQLQAKAPRLDSEKLRILESDPDTGEPIPLEAATLVSVDAGQLSPEHRYHFAIRPVDACGRRGPITTAEVMTTQIHFETVSPCFVATAAHGSPLAEEVGILRRLRDRHLANHVLGRAVVRAYHAVGPEAARLVRHRPWLRASARTALAPLVAFARLVTN